MKGIQLSLIIIGFITIVGCSHKLPEYSITTDRDYDFSKVKTYGYLPRNNIVGNSSAANRLELDVDYAFSKKKLKRVDEKDADILISITEMVLVPRTKTTQHASSHQSLGAYRCRGRCVTMASGADPSVKQVTKSHTQGYVRVDLVDPESKFSVWSVEVIGSSEGAKSTAEWRESIEKLTVEIFEKFPEN